MSTKSTVDICCVCLVPICIRAVHHDKTYYRAYVNCKHRKYTGGLCPSRVVKPTSFIIIFCR